MHEIQSRKARASGLLCRAEGQKNWTAVRSFPLCTTSTTRPSRFIGVQQSLALGSAMSRLSPRLASQRGRQADAHCSSYFV